MLLKVEIPYPIRDCGEQYYNEAIVDLAHQVFLIPYRGELGLEPVDLKQTTDELDQIMKDMCDVFDKPMEQVMEDIDKAITDIPLEDFEQSVDLRKLNLLN